MLNKRISHSDSASSVKITLPQNGREDKRNQCINWECPNLIPPFGGIKWKRNSLERR